MLRKIMLFFVSDVFAAFSGFEEEFSKKPEKLAAWNAMAEDVASWTDKIGMPIKE